MKIIALFFSLLLLGCGGSNNLNSLSYELFSLSNLKSNLEFLASDDLEGREAATQAEKVASQFIASELKKYGVKPFGDDGTYFQNFQVKLTGFDENSKITLNAEGEQKILGIGKDFASVFYKVPGSLTEVKNKQIVFAGYGITSEENNYDDYKEIDVNGKVVLILSGSPSYFKENSEFFRASSKIRMAEAKGAAGLLIIPGEYAITRWDIYSKRSLDKSFISGDNEYNIEKSIPAFMLSETAAIELLQQEKYSYNKLKELAEEDATLPFFELKQFADFDVKVNSGYASVRNVVGLIEGTDVAVKNEYVSIGAHFDHEGVHNGEVYNGANDNASGTSALLETAKAFALSGLNKRSVVVIFYTAEEKGLIGSRYFTANSKIMDDIVVNINMDMLGSGSSDSLLSVGSGRLSRELYDLAVEVNANTTKFIFDYTFDAPDHPERIYYRSDHYQFAQKGIPAVFFTVEDRVNYHKPTDDSEHINFEKVLKVSRLVYNLGLHIANLDHRLKVDADGISTN
ncbi:MAG: M28 family peptidase [Ignavibacteriaceae bacterium]